MTTPVSGASTTAADPQSNAAGLNLNGDFTLFLKLLTAQMQNQDPLDPMDTSQYTQQLVQYSQVEQSIQQNSTLRSILGQLDSQNLTSASTMIGRVVELDTPNSGLAEGSPAIWTWSSSTKAETITATIADSKGNTVATKTIDGGTTGNFTWDGTMEGGKKAPPGTYTLTLKALNADGKEIPTTVHSVGVVGEVRAKDGVITLGVNGAYIPLSTLIGVANLGTGDDTAPSGDGKDGENGASGGGSDAPAPTPAE